MQRYLKEAAILILQGLSNTDSFFAQIQTFTS